MNTLLSAALEYAENDIPVFPLVPKEKKPLTTNGLKDATRDIFWIQSWWGKNPSANLGIPMGRESGVIGIDIDFKDGCNPDFVKRLPPTVMTLTPTGGYHAFFKYDERIKNGLKLEKGATIRSDGYYFVAPPSIHPLGGTYTFTGRSLWDGELAELPEWVYEINEREKAKKEKEGFLVPQEVNQGSRNDTLFRYCCSLRATGQSEGAIRIAATVYNGSFKPPLETEEVERIVGQACGYPEGKPKALLPGDAEEDEIIKSSVTALGFNDDEHHYISQFSRKVIALTPSAHTELRLLELMPLCYWRARYTDIVQKEKKDGTKYETRGPIKWNQAADDLLQKSLSSGFFNPKKIRGTGFYEDEKRLVLNSGSEIIVAGKKLDYKDFESNYFYTPHEKIELTLEEPLSIWDCDDIVKMISSLKWKEKDAAKFVLGWLVVAPFSGALKWRPHIWMNGSKGTGKSWFIENILHPMLEGVSELFLSNSTEAGMRQSLKNNAKPVIWDEPEVNNESDNRMIQRVLALARQASFESSGKIAKGTASGQAMEFNIKSCFFLGSIKDALQEGADESRFTIINLLQEENNQRRIENFEALKKTVFDVTLSNKPQRLIARTASMWSVLQENMRVIGEVLSETHNARVGQQYGALLGGWQLLMSDEAITKEEAQCLVEDVEIPDIEHIKAHDDRGDVLEHLYGKIVDVDASEGNSGKIRISIGELIEKGDTSDRLPSWGIKVFNHAGHKEVFICAKHPQLRDLFRDSKWVSGWQKSLMNVPGAEKSSQWVGGAARYGVKIPFYGKV